MEITRCVKCEREVRLPESTVVVWVRCPLCGEEYAIDDILDRLPPRLLAISRPARGASVKSPELLGADLPEPPVSSNLPEASPPVARSHDVPVEEKIKVPTPQQLHASRKNPRSVTRSARLLPLKIAGGGVLGLLLGQLALWWLPSPLRTDPFHLAPRLPEGASFLAPASLRGDLPAPVPPQPPVNGRDDSPDLLQDDMFAETFGGTLDDNPGADGGPSEIPQVAIGLIDAPRYQMKELQASLEQATKVHDDFETKNEWSRAAVEAWYVHLCDLAHRVTFPDMRDKEGLRSFADSAHQFLARVASDSRRLRAIGGAGAWWIKNSDNNRGGIVLAGVVTRVSAAGELFQTQLSLAGSKNTSIAVVSRVDPRQNSRETYDVGDTVLIVGVIVVDPSLYLLGYQGDADTVVLGGMPLKVM